ncbi:MAG: ParB/RepB/Spo0J family partition protein [Sporomusaceae bacterium]|nr:ParB/RepB/Spo0J family partition protein [Sporomusaceae bacterium]
MSAKIHGQEGQFDVLKGEAMITNIRIDAISPHPDNPRKDLGDLTELAESIKAQGILQNLTVVAAPGSSETHWRVVIGHRRLAAAQLAGLEEVPCVVSVMDDKTQVATMLLENMQRSDLTIWEQAQGLQMMLNFGETVDSVAELTGFSGSTIRRRVKLLELDGDKFKKSVARGATLADYAELDKISSVEMKNKVLEKVGTADFQWTLKSALDAEKREKNQAALITELEKFAVRVEKGDRLRTVEWYSCDNPKKVAKPVDAGEKKYYFMVSGSYVQLLTDAEGQPQRPAYTGPSPEEQERRTRLDALNKQAYELRQAFVKGYAGRQGDRLNIMAFALWALINNDADWRYDDKVCAMLGIEIPEDADEDEFDEDEFTAHAVAEKFDASPERTLLVAAYIAVEPGQANLYNWKGAYTGSPALATLYSYLERLGYEISEEELQLMDGTHELYVQPEVKNVGGAVCPGCEKPVKPACVHADDNASGCCASCEENKAHNCNSAQPCRKDGSR